MLPMSVLACEGIRFLALVSEEKRRPQIRLRFAGYVSTVVCCFRHLVVWFLVFYTLMID